MIVARTHERVQNQRNDFQHKLAKHYVDNYDLVVTEKLEPLNMVQNQRLSRSIADASWSSFNQKLAYKAERAGKLFVQVDAKHTSQICPVCGSIAAKTLPQRIHDCPYGYKDGRDHASSLVILERDREGTVGTTGTQACGHSASTSSRDETSQLDEARSSASKGGVVH